MLEKPELAKQKPVKAYHVIELVDCEYYDKSQEELQKRKVTSEAVPN